MQGGHQPGKPRKLACLPLLVFPCTIKSRSALLAPAHLGGSGKRAVTHTHTHMTVLWPFFWDYPGELVPEEIFFWTLWCKGR